MKNYHLTIQISSGFDVVPLEARSYTQVYYGEVHARNDEDVRVGKFVCQFVNVHAAINDGVNVESVFDCDSSEVDGYYPVMYKKNGEQRRFFSSKNWDGDWIEGSNLLIISRLGILPKYRKKGYGLAVLKSLTGRVATFDSVVGLNPVPMQYWPGIENDPWHQEFELFNLPLDRKEYHRKKLESYFSKLRFVRIPKTDVMLISTAMPLPGYQDLMI